jgi:hypothetical protein
MQPNTRPTEGDWVLIREMAPNQPEIAQAVSQQALNSDSSDTESDSDEEMSDELPDTPRSYYNRRRMNRTHEALPITLDPRGISATVLACHDTGSEVNIISETLARGLGFTDFEDCSEEDDLQLPNCKIIRAIGKITIPCSFGVEVVPRPISCIFHVLRVSASPLLMGLDFLEETDTMAKRLERFIRVPCPAFQPHSIFSVGRPRKRMSCTIKETPFWALPDSGCDVNLLTPPLATALKLRVDPLREALQLIDGTIIVTTGIVRAYVSLQQVGLQRQAPNRALEFLLTNAIRQSVILGNDSLDTLGVFTDNKDALVEDPSPEGPLELARIRSLGSFDEFILWIKTRIMRRRPPTTIPGQ